MALRFPYKNINVLAAEPQMNEDFTMTKSERERESDPEKNRLDKA